MSIKKIITIVLILLFLVVGGVFYYFTFGQEQKVLTEKRAITFTEELLTNVKFARHNLIWEQIDEPSQQIYGDAQSYEEFFDVTQKISREEAIRDFSINRDNVTVRDSWTSPQGVTYNNVYDIPIEITLNKGETERDTYYVFEVNGELKSASEYTKEQYNEIKQVLIEGGYLEETVSTEESENKEIKDTDVSLPKSEYVSPAPTSALPTRIEGLASIRMGGGIWENWDADAEKDGAFIEVVYLDSRGEIITSDEAINLPISADVKIFTTDTSNYSFKKGRLVFSAHYSKEQIIFGNWLYPRIRIPKEQINVNPDVDKSYGYASITIHTPEQGDFSDESNLGFIVLYEE